jgi:hypothetical protein
MTNTERIVSALRDEPGLSDSELRRITRIEPHQQVNQICRRLASQGIVRRQRGAGCLVPLIYAGQAGATSRRTKTESRATLRSRIGGNHLRGNIRSSNFRKTISALLLQPLGLQLAGLNKLDPASNRIVSEWIRRHLHVVTALIDDRAALANIEHRVLDYLDPPLNLDGMDATLAHVLTSPGRRTRRISLMAWSGSGMLHSEKAHTTLSKDSSSKVRWWASPSS